MIVSYLCIVQIHQEYHARIINLRSIGIVRFRDATALVGLERNIFRDKNMKKSLVTIMLLALTIAAEGQAETIDTARFVAVVTTKPYCHFFRIGSVFPSSTSV